MVGTRRFFTRAEVSGDGRSMYAVGGPRERQAQSLMPLLLHPGNEAYGADRRTCAALAR